MSRVFVITDTHFGHKNICSYRPEFKSVEHHDSTIFDNIMSTVSKRDSLWLLGDCFFTRESYELARIISDSVAFLNFVPGNHDTDTGRRNTLCKEAIGSGIFHKVGSLFKHKRAWLSHAPIHPRELRGCINVHGHVHANTIPDNRYFNACCENINYTPVDLTIITNTTKELPNVM